MTKILSAFFLFFVFFLTSGYQTPAKSAVANYPYIQNERLMPLALREIYDAQNIYQETVGNGNFGTLPQLVSSGLLNRVWEDNGFRKYGYGFEISKTDMTLEPDSPAKFYVTTFPLKYRRTGRKSFHLDYLGVIRAGDKNGSMATGDEPVVGNFVYSPLTVRSDSRAINNLRLIHSAQMTYQATAGNGNFGLFNELYEAGLINNYLRTASFGGYNFSIIKSDLLPGIIPAAFYARATPVRYNSTGIRSFYINETGVLRGADKNGAFATIDDPPIEK